MGISAEVFSGFIRAVVEVHGDRLMRPEETNEIIHLLTKAEDMYRVLEPVPKVEEKKEDANPV